MDDNQKWINVHGRVCSRRVHKTCSFVDLELRDQKLQLLLSKDFIPPRIGDIVSVCGYMGMTRSNMPALYVDQINTLASCRSPDQLDSSKKEKILKIAQLKSMLRKAFQNIDAVEVSTPVLSPFQGTSGVNPFRTKDKSGQDLFLKFTHEMELKKIVVETLLPVFEIGHVFRNFKDTSSHKSEYEMLEAQLPYQDLSYGIGFVGKTLEEIAEAFNHKGFSSFSYQTVDEILKRTNLNLSSLTPAEKKTLYKTEIKKMEGPVFVTEPPIHWFPLAVQNENGTAKDAKLIYKGVSLAHLSEEKNNPADIEASLTPKEGDRQKVDRSFIDKMYQGFPPSVGIAISVDRTYSTIIQRNYPQHTR